MHSVCVCMICLNHRYEPDRPTLDLYSGQKGQISMLQSQRRTQDRLVVARVRVYVYAYCMLYLAISDSHHLEGVSKKNQQKPLKILGSS